MKSWFLGLLGRVSNTSLTKHRSSLSLSLPASSVRIVRGKMGTVAIRIVLGTILVTTLMSHVSGEAHGREGLKQQPVCCPRMEASGKPEQPDKKAAFQKVQKLVSEKSAEILAAKMGKNYLTERIAPLALESLYKTFVPKKSGRIELKSPTSILDRTLNSLLGMEKKRLSKWTQKKFPALPLVGHLVSAIVESQKVHFSNGVPSHEMRFKQRVGHQYQLGDYPLSSGMETRFYETEFARTNFAALSYTGEDEEYRVDLFGKRLGFHLETKHLKADVRYDPRGVKFNVKLTF